jgi:hypothetical protein
MIYDEGCKIPRNQTSVLKNFLHISNPKRTANASRDRRHPDVQCQEIKMLS